MTSAELTKALWDLANGVTGFAAVQALVFAYACAKKEVGDIINRKAVKFAIAVMLATIALAQAAAVEWCRIHLTYLDPAHADLHFEAGIGRIVLIGGLAIFSIVILYARQLFAGKPFDR
jgi:hypothetical protein